jgi:hypothetical protein
VTGDHSALTRTSDIGADPYNSPNVTRTTAELQNFETVLACHSLWLAVLTISGSVMFLSALAAVAFGLMRRGPEVLDCFVSTLRDSPYLRTQMSSLGDGTDMAKRLRDTKVMLGDVRSGENVGKIAVAVQSEKQHVQRLRPDRLYR